MDLKIVQLLINSIKKIPSQPNKKGQICYFWPLKGQSVNSGAKTVRR